MVEVKDAGGHEALTAEDRDAVLTVERQLESAGHLRCQQEVLRRADLEAADSAHSREPVPAGMAGLSTAPYLLYKTIGFDALHVSGPLFFRSLFPCFLFSFAIPCFLFFVAAARSVPHCTVPPTVNAQVET